MSLKTNMLPLRDGFGEYFINDDTRDVDSDALSKEAHPEDQDLPVSGHLAIKHVKSTSSPWFGW
jgi:hypothetical protein